MAAFAKEEEHVFTVTEITRQVRDVLESRFGTVWVEGEISNYRHHTSGHHYFTLKDDGAQLSCVFFRGYAQGLRVQLGDGQQIQAGGDLTVYEARGQYQLMVRFAQPKGFGALQAKFEALKQKLEAEGLFHPAHKRPIPRFPQTIAIVTSPTGAAIRDILNVLRRRAPWLRVLIWPARVQGAGGEAEIARAISRLSELSGTGAMPHIDTLLVTRGGGSIEDLWNFNEEVVARAIYDCGIPVISAVGHEIDFTISDFVADLRAPTPSAAAELVVADGQELKRRLSYSLNSLDGAVSRRAAALEQLVGMLGQGLKARAPVRLLASQRQHIDHLYDRMQSRVLACVGESAGRVRGAARLLSMIRPHEIIDLERQSVVRLHQQMNAVVRSRLVSLRDRLAAGSGMLRSLNPEAVLSRGFSLTTNTAGVPITTVRGVAKGETIITRLADGSVESRVSAVAPAEDAARDSGKEKP